MIKAALIGNPNVGKTTLFNLLTGSNQHVGNWGGVTVDKKEGYVDNLIKIVDLPGVYALDAYSNEEKLSKEYLQQGNPDLIINIVDGTNLSRNLYLTLQLLPYKKPIILVINMVDELDKKGIKIDYNKLESILGIRAIPISASFGIGIENLIEKITKEKIEYKKPKIDFDFASEKDAYDYIDKVLLQCMIFEKNKEKDITDTIDKLLLNKYLSYPLFLGILYMIFKITFNWVGQPLSDLFDVFLQDIVIARLNIYLINSSIWFKSLIIDGIVGGVGSVLIFLPVILTLFTCITFLEDSGYMARAAFIMDSLMRKMGLSGKAFIPMVVGFGCSVPGIMSARTLESEKDRKLAALLVPLMSCNARLPVYALFASVFFFGHESTVVFSIYLLGIVMAFVVGIVFKNTIFKKLEEPFIIELPKYRLPNIKSLMLHTWEKGKGFVKKAGTLIFSVSVIVWFLSNFNTTGMCDIDKSFLSYAGQFISPIFAPLGFNDWRISVSLLTGLMAKEVVIGTLGALFGSDLKTAILSSFTPASAYGFMVFVLLYTPCISVIGAMKKEYGTRFMAFSIIYQLVLAWVMAFIVYRLGSLII